MSDSPTSNPLGPSSTRLIEPHPAGRPEKAEFDRFTDLAGKLVNVSKAELDEKRKDES